MKSLKTSLALAVLAVAASINLSAFAEGVAVVDMDAISQKYVKAQNVTATAKTKEDELQKFRDMLQGQLKAADKLSPIEKKNMEEKLNQQFMAKFKEYRDWMVAQQQSLKADFDNAIRQVSQAKSYDVILPKQGVIQGGRDITQEVVDVLNK